MASTCGAGGAVMLQDTFGGTNDMFQGVIPVTGGGWLFYGTSSSKGAGGQDGWIVRTDASLGFLWEKTFGSTQSDDFSAGVGHADGTFTLVGQRTDTKNSPGNQQAWAVHVDATGKQLWEFAGGAANQCNGLVAAAANGQGVVVAGKYGTGGGDGSACGTGWVLQFDLAGNQLWEAKPDGASSLSAVAALDTGVAIAGTTSTFTYNGWSNTATLTDVFVKRLKPGGTLAWSASFFGQATSIDAMTVLANGQVAVAGRQGNAAQSPQFRAAVDPAGTIAWQTGVLGTTGTPRSLAETSFGLVTATWPGSNEPASLVAVSKDAGALLWKRDAQWKAGSAYLYDVRPAGTGLVAAGVKYGVGAWGMLLSGDGWAGCECTDTCNDAKDCTSDWCTLGKCSATPAPSGTACKTATNIGTCDAASTCKTLCANSKCDMGETYANCPVDCIPSCGNGTCEATETASSCPTDCYKGPAHFCDTHCGGQGSGCYCDSACKSSGDCCDATGTAKAGKTCAGSTCSSCN